RAVRRCRPRRPGAAGQRELAGIEPQGRDEEPIMTLTRTAPRARSVKGRAPARMAEPRIADSPLERKPIEDVWKLYQRSGDEDIRNYLVQKYLHVVRFSADRLGASLPG